jgi:hypothetical protein
MRVIRIVVVVVPVLAAPVMTRAQGFSVSPAFGISQMYDDNLFSTPAAEGDTITRVSSRVDARYRTEAQTLSVRYALDADWFAHHPDLTTAHARQDAGFEQQYQATGRLSFNGAAAFTETETPAELNLATALAPGRARARRLTLQPSASYEISPSTNATIGYVVAHDAMLDVRLLTQTATVAVEHHRSARDGVRWEYSYQSYLFDAIERTTSQVLTATWTRDLTPATSLSLRGGPRLTDRTLSADAGVSFHHKMRIGDATLAYAHTQATLVGLLGIVDTHSVTARLGGELRSGLQLRLEPGLLHTTQTNLASTVSRVSIGGLQPIGRRLAIEVSYDLNLQQGNIYAAQGVASIGRHVVALKLVAAATEPVRR